MAAAVEPTIVIRGCRALLGDDARYTPEPVDIVVRDRQIAAIVPGGTAPPGQTEIDGSRRLVVAGTINGHQHSHEHFQKGRFENLPLDAIPKRAGVWMARREDIARHGRKEVAPQ